MFRITVNQKCKRQVYKLNTQIKKVVVVGRDADAWLSALMLQLSFAKPEQSIEVHLVELPSKLHPHDTYSVLPSHKVLHKMLGISENMLFKAAAAQYALGQRFVNWTDKSSYFHCYDTHGINIGHVEFFQYWIKARQNGFEIPLEDFSLGVEVAKQGRFLAFSDDVQSFSKATYGYHLNALAYLQLIAKAAINAGLQHHISQIKSVEIDEGVIKSLILETGSVVNGDLFIDASGPEARLIGELEDTENFSSWQEWLPCDRKIILSAPTLSPAPVFTQITAFKQGWIGFSPLPNRTAVTAIYSSRHASNNDVLQTMTAISRAKTEGAVESSFQSGARKKLWIGNCIAIGSAAVNLEPLDALQLHALHLGLSLLRLFFPVNKSRMIEADTFNQKMQSLIINFRDFQIAHYKLNRRFNEPFWDALRNMAIPETLAAKIELFKHRGVIALLEDETFQEENWTSIFVGHGLIPHTFDPLVNKLSEEEHIEQFQNILRYVVGEAQAMPSLSAHIEMTFESNKHSMF